MTDFELKELIDELVVNLDLSDVELLALLAGLKKADKEIESYLYDKADIIRRQAYGNAVYIRGLIELTNYCKNDCYYCGIRKSNTNAVRYRLSDEDILNCCIKGYELGFRTFVLQGGEDLYYTDSKICEIVSNIKEKYPDCAVTLSIGEKSKESYEKYFKAGADRYLLRHETANIDHYKKLHPSNLSAKNRQQCLFDLKEIGYQVGCGIMVGTPGQTDEHILEDLRFMQKLKPHMIGIGPFIPHKDTPFHNKSAGSYKDTLHILSIIRLMFPYVLLPATTALGTIHPDGQLMGIKAGTNVIMPNLSPIEVRKNYSLYDGKLATNNEAAENLEQISLKIKNIGYSIEVNRGDCINHKLD